jgi:hypothetical protein
MKANEVSEQYISKSTLVAEIERLELCTMDEHMNYYSAEAQGEYNALSKLESFIDTLEVKEVDSNDAFIEKACGWLKESVTNNPECNRIISKKGVITMGELIEDFRKYMGK